MLALGLALDNDERWGRSLAPRQLVKLYEEHGSQIFEQSLWRKVRSVQCSGGSVLA